MDKKLLHPAAPTPTATRPPPVLDAPAPAAPVPLAPVVGREGGALDARTSAAIDARRGGGRPLDDAVRDRMQSAFSADFSRVRIHDDAGAAQLNRLVSARAFTTGSDIFFGSGQYAPSTPQGERVLAHELAHTLQGDPGTPLARTVRRAGDKIAFDKVPPSSLGGEDAELSGLIETAIAAHQKQKSQAKDRIEKEKDDGIDAVNARGLEKDDAVTARAGVLKDWHREYQATGWNLTRLKAEILAATGKRVAFDERDPSSIAVNAATSGIRLYTILKGAARFGSPIDGGRVVVKKGTQKEYVQDARGVFVSRYVHRGCSLEQMMQLFTTKVMLPRNQSDTIGTQSKKFQFGTRTADGKITDQERDFLQQRDGSGANQRMLSVTHAKPSRKVHSNHGELFGSEAIVKVDLSLVPKTDTFNLHSAETHDSKTSLPQVRTDKKDPSNQKVVPADREKESYIYSAEKNRETVLLRIPVEAVVAVRTADNVELSLLQAQKRYNEHFEAEELERRQEEERRTKAREKNEARKAEAASAEEREDQVKARVEDLAQSEAKLAKWKEVSLFLKLMDVRSKAWMEPVAGVAIDKITWQQAKKVFEAVDRLGK